MFLHSVPESKMRSSHSRVVSNRVIRIGHPKGRRGHIVVQETRTGVYENAQVVFKRIPGFDSVLEEESPAPDVVDDVVGDQRVGGVVDVDCAVEGAVDPAADDVGVGHVAVAVEVDGVAAEAERLPRVVDLRVRDARRRHVLVLTRAVDHDLRSELVAPQLLPKSALEARLGSEFSWFKKG